MPLVRPMQTSLEQVFTPVEIETMLSPGLVTGWKGVEIKLSCWFYGPFLTKRIGSRTGVVPQGRRTEYVELTMACYEGKQKNISHAITFVVAQSSITHHHHQALFDCVLTVSLELIPIMLASEIRDLDHLRLGDRIRPAHGYLTDLGRL